MKVGTRSLLFGVHQFLWHPYTVLRAFIRLYGWPSFWELVAIVVHDWGYWGKPNIDGPEGETHALAGAKFVAWLYHVTHRRTDEHRMEALRLFAFTLLHSRFAAAKWGHTPSALCWADKLSVWYDPKWFYLLRAKLSREIKEYRQNARNRVALFAPDRYWFDWYRTKVIDQIETKRPASARHHLDD